MSEKIWSDDAWEDYLYWQTQDKKTLKRINQLIQDIERNGCMKGIGKPEPLSGTCRANTAAASTRKTASSTIWKMGGSTSPTAEATMEINNPPQSEHTQKLSNPSALPIPHTPPDTNHSGFPHTYHSPFMKVILLRTWKRKV